MVIKKRRIYLLLSSLLLLCLPSLGYDLHAHLLITSDINLISSDTLSFKLFNIFVPRYNLFPIFIWMGSFFGLLPASTFFFLIYLLLINNFCRVIDRFRFVNKLFFSIIFTYLTLGFGVLEIASSAILINLLSKKEDFRTYNFYYLAALISWPGFILTNFIFLIKLIFGNSKYIKKLIIFRLGIIYFLTTIFIIFFNLFLEIETTRDYNKYLEMLSQIVTLDDLLSVPKLGFLIYFLLIGLLFIILNRIFIGKFFVRFLNLYSLKVSAYLINFVVIFIASIYILIPKLVINNSRMAVYPPIIFNSGLVNKSYIPYEDDVYRNSICALTLPVFICKSQVFNYGDASSARLSYLNKVLYYRGYYFFRNANKE